MRSFVLLLLAACGSAAPTVDLPTQWDALEGAVGNGTVEKADASELHVVYEGAPHDLVDEWTKAAQAGGWTVSDPQGLPGLMSFDLSKGDENLQMMISARGSRADVLVTK